MPKIASGGPIGTSVKYEHDDVIIRVRCVVWRLVGRNAALVCVSRTSNDVSRSVRSVVEDVVDDAGGIVIIMLWIWICSR